MPAELPVATSWPLFCHEERAKLRRLGFDPPIVWLQWIGCLEVGSGERVACRQPDDPGSGAKFLIEVFVSLRDVGIARIPVWFGLDLVHQPFVLPHCSGYRHQPFGQVEMIGSVSIRWYTSRHRSSKAATWSGVRYVVIGLIHGAPFAVWMMT